MTESIIVYRSQVQANADQFFASGDGVLYLLGAIFFIVFFALLHKGIEQAFGWKKANKTSYLQLGVSLIASVLFVKFVL